MRNERFNTLWSFALCTVLPSPWVDVTPPTTMTTPTLPLQAVWPSGLHGFWDIFTFQLDLLMFASRWEPPTFVHRGLCKGT